ncbi:hypothetical protein BLSTO_00534 [Blastocystis sp. subtype 1]
MEPSSPTDTSPKPCPTEIEDRLHVLRNREQTLRKDYDKCISWRVRYFTGCTLLAVPLSIWTKRYTPLLIGGLVGTAGDVWDAKVKCGKMADELDDVIEEKEKLEKLNAPQPAESM